MDNDPVDQLAAKLGELCEGHKQSVVIEALVRLTCYAFLEYAGGDKDKAMTTMQTFINKTANIIKRSDLKQVTRNGDESTG